MPSSSHASFALFALGLAALVAGCAARSSYREGVYEDRAVRFKMDSPGAGYERIDSAKDEGLAWEGPEGAIIQASGRCERALDIPLKALLGHLVIGFTEQEILSEELYEMDGREALERHLRAKVDGVPREFALRVLKKDGCVYDFALIAAVGGAFERARPAYESAVRSFATR